MSGNREHSDTIRDDLIRAVSGNPIGVDAAWSLIWKYDALLAENQRLRDAAEGMRNTLLRGSPGWLETPAGRKLLEALAGDAE